MRRIRITFVVLLAAVALGQRTSAQDSLPFDLFQRYLEALRVQTGIPGLSAAIVQGRRLVWDGGFGLQDVESSVTARADTPYPIGDLTQTLAATLLLGRCMEDGHLRLEDRMRRWSPDFGETDTTVGQILTHAPPSGGFRYAPQRYAELTTVIKQCVSQAYRKAVAQEILDLLGMASTAPGRDSADLPSAEARLFHPDTLAQYASVLRRIAVPYKVDSQRRPTRSEYPPAEFTTATGMVSTVRDLARFQIALDDGDLLRPDTLALARRNAANGDTRLPTGLGWFVQTYKNEPLVWHFGLMREAFSSLVLTLPNRELTLILLANSDGLSAPYALERGDVTTSLFAQKFLQIFVP